MGAQQVVDSIKELGLSDQLSLSIGELLYGTEKCWITVSEQDNLIHLFRLNSKRNLYCSPKILRVKQARSQGQIDSELDYKMIQSVSDLMIKYCRQFLHDGELLYGLYQHLEGLMLEYGNGSG